MKPIPNEAVKIVLQPMGHGDPGCIFVVLWAIYKDGSSTRIWESSMCDNHPDELKWAMKFIRDDMEEAFDFYGFDTNDVSWYDKDCIWDWEYEYLV